LCAGNIFIPRNLEVIYLIRRMGLFFIFIFCLSGCYYNSIPIVHSNDVEFNATIRPFYTTSEYITYFNSNDISDIGNTIRIDLNWNMKNIGSFDQNLYAPYIMVIPLEEGWLYAGADRNIPSLIGNRTSIKGEIIEKIFYNDHSYDWQNINIIGIHTRAKSFNQGFVTLSFKKSNLNAKDSPLFKVYLIYYDPVRKTGWYKVMNQEANLVGLPSNAKT